jgi:tRNA-2-methylthio-N6-dimethylallyladenosine synthase
MSDQIPRSVVQRRFDRLVEVQRQISLQRNARHLSEVVEVLVEGSSKKDPSKLTGRTRTNKLIHFTGQVAPGQFRMVRVTSAAPNHLEGELVQSMQTEDRLASV